MAEVVPVSSSNESISDVTLEIGLSVRDGYVALAAQRFTQRLCPTTSAQRESDALRHTHRHRNTIQQGRRVLPLTDAVNRRPIEQR